VFKEIWKFSPTFVVIWVLSALLGLTFAGVVIWAIVRAVQKFL
jgi:phosphate/sulfate permease